MEYLKYQNMKEKKGDSQLRIDFEKVVPEKNEQKRAIIIPFISKEETIRRLITENILRTTKSF